MGRVGQPIGKRTVVHQEQEPTGGGVEATDRDDTLGDVDELHHRWAALLVAERRHETLGLVHHQIDVALFFDRHTIDRHDRVRTNLRARLGNHAIHTHAPFGDQGIGTATRGNTTLGEEPIESYGGCRVVAHSDTVLRLGGRPRRARE